MSDRQFCILVGLLVGLSVAISTSCQSRADREYYQYQREIRKAEKERLKQYKRELRARSGQKSGLALAVQALIWLLGFILFAVLTPAIYDLIPIIPT